MFWWFQILHTENHHQYKNYEWNTFLAEIDNCVTYSSQMTHVFIIIFFRLWCGKDPLSEPMLAHCSLDPDGKKSSVKFELKYKHLHTRKLVWKYCLKKCQLFSRPPLGNIYGFRYYVRYSLPLCHCLDLSCINSLWPRDAIWRQGSRSTLVQVMACCLMAPSQYLNQCWLIITKVQWCSSEGNFAWDITAISD